MRPDPETGVPRPRAGIVACPAQGLEALLPTAIHSGPVQLRVAQLCSRSEADATLEANGRAVSLGSGTERRAKQRSCSPVLHKLGTDPAAVLHADGPIRAFQTKCPGQSLRVVVIYLADLVSLWDKHNCLRA